MFIIIIPSMFSLELHKTTYLAHPVSPYICVEVSHGCPVALPQLSPKDTFGESSTRYSCLPWRRRRRLANRTRHKTAAISSPKTIAPPTEHTTAMMTSRRWLSAAASSPEVRELLSTAAADAGSDVLGLFVLSSTEYKICITTHTIRLLTYYN